MRGRADLAERGRSPPGRSSLRISLPCLASMKSVKSVKCLRAPRAARPFLVLPSLPPSPLPITQPTGTGFCSEAPGTLGCRMRTRRRFFFSKSRACHALSAAAQITKRVTREIDTGQRRACRYVLSICTMTRPARLGERLFCASPITSPITPFPCSGFRVSLPACAHTNHHPHFVVGNRDEYSKKGFGSNPLRSY